MNYPKIPTGQDFINDGCGQEPASRQPLLTADMVESYWFDIEGNLVLARQHTGDRIVIRRKEDQDMILKEIKNSIHISVTDFKNRLYALALSDKPAHEKRIEALVAIYFSEFMKHDDFPAADARIVKTANNDIQVVNNDIDFGLASIGWHLYHQIKLLCRHVLESTNLVPQINPVVDRVLRQMYPRSHQKALSRIMVTEYSLYIDAVHGIQVAALGLTDAWFIIRKECEDRGIEPPGITNIAHARPITEEEARRIVKVYHNE